jgi:hypothetical protein
MDQTACALVIFLGGTAAILSLTLVWALGTRKRQ